MDLEWDVNEVALDAIADVPILRSIYNLIYKKVGRLGKKTTDQLSKPGKIGGNMLV